MVLLMKVRYYVLSLTLAVSGLLLMPVMALAQGPCFANDGTNVYTSTDAQAVRDAVSAASAGDTVKVAGYCQGTMNEFGSDQVVYVDKSITLRGGYTTTDWLVSDPMTYITTLDADNNGRVIKLTSPATDFLLENMHLTKAFVNDNGNGGAILATNMVQNVTISNSVIISNTVMGGVDGSDGGGLYSDYVVMIIGSQFISNVATNEGGAVYVGDDLTVVNSRFTDNAVPAVSGIAMGGALFVHDTLTLIDSDFVNNKVTNGEGGAIYVYGEITINGGSFELNSSGANAGAISADSRLAISGTRFLTNTTNELNGGAIYIRQSFAFGYEDNVRIENSYFASNICQYSWCLGGAISLNSGYLMVTNTQFINNYASISGGAIYANVQYAASMVDSYFEGNAAYNDGGAFRLNSGDILISHTQFLTNGSAFGSNSGAFFNFSGGRTDLNNVLFEGNKGTQGGGAYILSDAFITNTVFKNNVASSQGGGAYVRGYATMTGTQFIGNKTLGPGSSGGGGLYVWDGVTMTQTQFINNSNGLELFGNNIGKDSYIVNSLFANNLDIALTLFQSSGDGGTAHVIHTTIANSSLTTGWGIYVADGVVNITDTIIANYTTGIEQLGGTVSENYNLFFDNGTNISGFTGGANSLTADPLFTDPMNNDYHLQTGSPAGGMGTPLGILTDYDGDARSATAPAPGYDEVAYSPPTISIADVTALEDSGSLVFTVTLSAASLKPVTVTYQTVDNSATTADNDYTAIGATPFVIPAGSISQTITVTVISDSQYELDETMLISLTNAMNVTLAVSQATGVILNDDTASLVVSAISGNTTESGGTASFTVSLSSAPTATVTIALTSSNLTEGNIISTSLTFDSSHWNIPQTVVVTGIDDVLLDGAQSYNIMGITSSSDPNYNNLSLNVAVINQDNDAPPNMSPIVSSNIYTMSQNTVLTVTAPGVLGNDSDPENNPLTAILTTTTSHGLLLLSNNGSFIYTPTMGYVGSDYFIYLANDGTSNSNAAIVTITIQAIVPTVTPTVTITATPTMTTTPTVTVTPTITVTPTVTVTATPTMTATATATPTITPTVTTTPSITVTPTPTQSVTPTPTGTVIPTATATPQPKVAVLQHGQTITNGQTTPITTGTTYRGLAISQTFFISNVGAAALIVNQLTLPNGFSLIEPQPFSLTLAAQTGQPFILRLDAAQVGMFNGLVQFNTNDPDNPLFTFPISGEVKAPKVLTCLITVIIAPIRIAPGKPVTFMIRVTNSCGERFLNLVIRFTLPNQQLHYDAGRDMLGWHKAVARGRQSSDSYEYTLAELAADQPIDLAFPVTVDAQAPLGGTVSPTVLVSVPDTISGEPGESVSESFILTIEQPKIFLPVIMR